MPSSKNSMKKASDQPSPTPGRFAIRFSAALLAPLLLGGCACFRDPVHMLDARARPTNVYASARQLSPQIRRLAVLPLTPTTPGAWLESGVESLQPILDAELAKTRKFDLVLVTPGQLRQLTGQDAWAAGEPLPPDFLDRLRDLTGCDAVLFSQLTRYQPYQPVAIGWKMSIVETQGRHICWAADEVFDGGDRAVANAAQDYSWGHFQGQDGASEPSLVLSSPTRFGQYALCALLETLPAR
jgi:hypothetical protein